MNTYWFNVTTGPITGEQVNTLYGLMAEGDGVDATISGDERGGEVEFSREAPNALHAIVSAVHQVMAAGISALGVTEDLIDLEGIAERAGVSYAAAGHWTTGERGPGGFPAPKIARRRGSIWSWADVAVWLATAGVGTVDRKATEVAAEAAEAAVLVNAALTLQQHVKTVPVSDRPLVASLMPALVAA